MSVSLTYTILSKNYLQRVALNEQVDTAVVTGNTEQAERLMRVNDVCPSLYALQLAMVRENFSTAHTVLEICHNRLRTKNSLKDVFWSPSSGEWSFVPEKHRY